MPFLGVFYLRGASMLKISDAASLALHTMVLLASQHDRLVSNKEIASVLKVSEAHLSKVLQRLAKIGLVHSIRGPHGGFSLGHPGERITLLQVYEAIEGPLPVSCNCLFDRQVCCRNHCILGNLLGNINIQIRDYLHKTTLAQLSGVYKCCYDGKTKR